MIKKSLLMLMAIVAIAATVLNTSCNCCTAEQQEEFSPADYVNPLVGTLSEFASQQVTPTPPLRVLGV